MKSAARLLRFSKDVAVLHDDVSLLVDDLQIFHGIHSVFHMCDLRILKASANMKDAIHSLYVR